MLGNNFTHSNCNTSHLTYYLKLGNGWFFPCDIQDTKSTYLKLDGIYYLKLGNGWVTHCFLCTWSTDYIFSSVKQLKIKEDKTQDLSTTPKLFGENQHLINCQNCWSINNRQQQQKIPLPLKIFFHCISSSDNMISAISWIWGICKKYQKCRSFLLSYDKSLSYFLNITLSCCWWELLNNLFIFLILFCIPTQSLHISKILEHNERDCFCLTDFK